MWLILINHSKIIEKQNLLRTKTVKFLHLLKFDLFNFRTNMMYFPPLRFGKNPKLYVIATLIVFLEVFIIIGNYIKATRPVIKRWRYLVSDISCHFEEDGDALPSAEDPSFSPNMKSIFFHETSCRGGLTSRQACSIETAARANPDSEIYVLFSAPVTEHILKRSCLAKLLEFKNVKMARVHLAEYSKGTVLESIMMDLEDTRHPVEHISDILRVLSLNKWGGIYLDTDMMVVHPLNELPPNWIVKQSDGSVPSAILSFGKDQIGKNVTDAILTELTKLYDPYGWSVYGARAIQKVLQRMCPDLLNLEQCNGIPIFQYELFYPLHYTLWNLYFKPGTFSNAEPPYTYHMWSHLSNYKKIEKNSPYDMLAKKHCPTIYEMYGDKFGI